MLDREQEEAELRYLFGEALSEYLQGYAYEQGPAAFDTLETASLNLGDDVPRQGFNKGGGLPSLSLSDMASNVTSNPVGMATTAASTAASIALGVNPVVGLVGNTISMAISGKTISDNLGFTDETGFFGSLGFPGNITYGSYATGLEDPTPPGVTTTQAGRQESFAETGSTHSITADAPSTSVTAPSSTTPTPGDYPEGMEADVTSTPSPDVATGDISGGADAASGDVSGEEGSGGEYSGGAKEGGQIKGYQEGSLVEDDQADTQLDTLGLGPIGIVDDPDGTTGVADDLEMELPVNSYVLNAEAVELAGVVSINKMIKEAIDLAIEDGVDLPKEIKASEKIPIRISQGEGAIPNPLVDYIGLKKLENMNNRGFKVRKQREAEEAPVEMAAAPSPQEDLLAQIQPVA